MNVMDYTLQMFPKMVNYRLARWKLGSAVRPITLTYSITGMCQSNCKTCNIGREYRKNPVRVKKLELKLSEAVEFFKNLGHIYFLNVSGGEPFLREDLPEIIDAAMKLLRPRVIHIPTNAFLPRRIEQVTRHILCIMDKYNHNVLLTVKPSVDGVGKKHDEIRGLTGSFEKLEETINRLKIVEKDHRNFHLELGTVISVFNIGDMEEIENWVIRQGVQSYRNEIAEQREEFFNIGEDITPAEELYEKTVKTFKEKVQRNLHSKRAFTKVTESLRLVYYDLAVSIMRERRQIIPCYAGISNIHLNYDGDVWPCCVLGYSHSMGNIRDFNYDYDALYSSKNAEEARAYIRKGLCFCPLANQTYSNILMSFPRIVQTFFNYMRYA